MTALEEITELRTHELCDNGSLYIEVAGVIGNHAWDPQCYCESSCVAYRLIPAGDLADLHHDGIPTATADDVRRLISEDDDWEIEEPEGFDD